MGMLQAMQPGQPGQTRRRLPRLRRGRAPLGDDGVRAGFARQVVLMAQLVWSAGPLLLGGLVALALVRGLLPVATILVTSALLQELTQAVAPSAAVIALPGLPVLLPQTLVLLLALLGATSAASQVVTAATGTVQRLYQTRMTNAVATRIAEHASALDLPFFENPEATNRLSNATTEASFRPLSMVNAALDAGTTAITVISVVALLAWWRLWIVPVLVVSALAQYAVSARYGRARARLMVERTTTSRHARYLNFLLTTDVAAKEIRLFGLRDLLLGRYRTTLDTLYRQDRALAGREARAVVAVQVLASLARPVLIGYVAVQTLYFGLSLGQFNLYSQAILQTEMGFVGLMLGLAQLLEHYLFLRTLFAFLALRPEIETIGTAGSGRGMSVAQRVAQTVARWWPFGRRGGASPTMPMPAFVSVPPRIEFRDVTFAYPGTATPVIQHLSFTLEPGELLALVGDNGAGKTTLVKLLAGLYLPTNGQILFDGVDSSLLPRDVLRARLGIIFQDYLIYHLSAYDNIALGAVDHMEDRVRVEQAARRAGFDQIAAGLDEGYETVLGRFISQGHELSGGQRQLVALARAYMRAAPVLILDEPTAALDTDNEELVFERLLDTHHDQSQTIIFISHRFSTVRRAQRILVLEHGHLLEDGSHEQLLAQRGRYAHLFETQRRAFGSADELVGQAGQASG